MVAAEEPFTAAEVSAVAVFMAVAFVVEAAVAA